jgi:hypothetical protein
MSEIKPTELTKFDTIIADSNRRNSLLLIMNTVASNVDLLSQWCICETGNNQRGIQHGIYWILLINCY